MYSKYILLNTMIVLLWLASCSTEDELIEEREETFPAAQLSGEAGTVNFSKYVAIGNSLTAGLMDAALYDNGQVYAFPNILAQHLERVEGIDIGAFNQPDIDATNGFNISRNDITNPQVAPFGRFELNLSPPGPLAVEPGDPILPYAGDKAALNNFGVPGMRAIEAVVPDYGQANPFFGRFASSPAASVLGDAVAAQGTFFTVWLGGNDVLSWAVEGGAPPDGEDSVAAQLTNPNTLTNIGSFTAAYQAVITSMLSVEGSKGVAITIPPVTLLPFFRLVPFNPIPLNEANAAALNAGYADYNNGLDAAVALGKISADSAATRKISFAAGSNNAIVIIDEDLKPLDISAALGAPAGSVVLPNLRQTNGTDIIPLGVATRLGQPIVVDGEDTGALLGLSGPAGDEVVLTQDEQAILLTRIATFNGIIAQIVTSTGGQVALLDINPLFADIAGLAPAQAGALGLGEAAVAAADGQRGLNVDGVNLQPDFSPNGIISTDGIHPNPRGHAIVANAIVNTINESFEETSIPNIDTAPFRTIIIASP